jgi:hypothetical protein
MSFGLSPPEPRTDGNEAAEQQALDNFRKLTDSIEAAIMKASPCIMFAAASNDGKNGKRAFPASCGSCICIHASDGNGNDCGINPPPDDMGPNFMTLGAGLELAKREWCDSGRRVPRFTPIYKSGTSFSTPVAAGIAAVTLDLVGRTDAIKDKDRTRRKLGTHSGMVRMLGLMAPESAGGYRYLAPWNHWDRNWQGDKVKSQNLWDTITLLF